MRKEKLTLNNYVIAEELHEAKVLWIKQNQIELKRKGDYKELKKNLSLREDEEGVIRSYGRYKHANIPFDNKAPIMLNRDHRLAEIIVNYCHSKVLHRGVKQTLTELRSKYWITKGRSFCVLVPSVNAIMQDRFITLNILIYQVFDSKVPTRFVLPVLIISGRCFVHQCLEKTIRFKKLGL